MSWFEKLDRDLGRILADVRKTVDEVKADGEGTKEQTTTIVEERDSAGGITRTVTTTVTTIKTRIRAR